jgi:hypothetical protein
MFPALTYEDGTLRVYRIRHDWQIQNVTYDVTSVRTQSTRVSTFELGDVDKLELIVEDTDYIFLGASNLAKVGTLYQIPKVDSSRLRDIVTNISLPGR